MNPQNNFKVLHYDGTISMHGTVRDALAEARLRLEPWRDAGDRVVQQLTGMTREETDRVLIVNSVNEPTDAQSSVSRCGDWIDARKLLPKVNQKILVHWLDIEGEYQCTSLFDSESLRSNLKEPTALGCVWWRPIPALPVECKGAKQC